MGLMTGKGSENWTFIEQAMDCKLDLGGGLPLWKKKEKNHFSYLTEVAAGPRKK